MHRLRGVASSWSRSVAGAACILLACILAGCPGGVKPSTENVAQPGGMTPEQQRQYEQQMRTQGRPQPPGGPGSQGGPAGMPYQPPR